MSTTASRMKPDPDLATILQAYNDVTERLKRSHESLAREVCRLREELHEKNRELARRERLSALGAMAAGVAHEIRNPLGGIGLYVSLLQRDLSDHPKELDILRKMSNGVRNLEGIVSDILAFAGDAKPHAQRVPVAGLLTAVVDQVEPRAAMRDIRIEVGRELDEAEVYGDAAQIERALINLMMNALDAVDRGGRVRVELDRNTVSEGMLRIKIIDNGPGIPAELMHRIFDPFFTTKTTGTGLGLAIVHRIAETNGGMVTAGNGERGGAVFVFSLPTALDRPESRSHRP